MARFDGAMCRALVALGAATLATAPAPTQKPGGLTALARLELGLWQLRDLESSEASPQSICVADPHMLLQVQHRNSPCSRLVISNGPNGATVHYTCPASGFGRTTLRVETPRLAKIETNGISDNAPFAYRLEARRTGSCSTASRAAR